MVLGDAEAPRASFNVEDVDNNDCVRSLGIIPADALLDMSKGSLKRYLIQEYPPNAARALNVQKLWDALLATMRNSSVVDRHMTAVCNAICVFLQSASSSADHSTRIFAMSAEVWMDVLDELLINFYSGKQKPLRQILNTLIKILAHDDNRTGARSIENLVLSKMAGIIMLQNPQPYFKASIVVFEAFLRSSIPISQILFAIAYSCGENRVQWEHRLRQLGFGATKLRQATKFPTTDDSICRFSFSIVFAVAESDAPATAGAFFARFMSALRDYSIPLGVVWIEHVVTVLHSYPRAIEAFKNYLFTPLFKLSPSHYRDLLYRVASADHDLSMLQNTLALLILGRDAGLLSEKDTATSLHHALQKPRTQPQYQDIDELHSSESNLYADLFKHSSAGVRISAYELLITSTETTKPMKSSTLSLLSSCLVYLQGDTDPGHRSEINNIIRSMIDRLRRGSALYARNLAKVESTNQQCRDHEHELEQHDKFLSWFINFLEDELGPGCSFSRHISALKAFQMLVESGLDPKIPKMMAHRSSQDLASWPYKKSLSHNTMKSALWQLLLDPFEEVRVTTAFVLNLLLQNDGVAINPCENNALGNEVTGIEVDDAQSAASDETDPPNFGLIGDIASLLEAANRLAAITNRADHADGVGRLLGFQYRLARSPSLLVSSVMERIENVICVSAGKTSLPAKDFSLHGYLLGLKYIIEGFPASESSTSGIIQTETNVHVDRLYNLCESVWRAVRSDLCVDSPEFSHDIDATGPYGGPKDFLSYSWRALRDSSLLMQAILQHLCPLKDEERLLVGRAQLLRSTYTLCFEQLTALRHRGAFSTVAQTFGLCCEQFATIPSLQAELQGHYQEAFHVLTDQSSKLTRRSAGLPAILAGLLNPSPTEDFNEVIESLVSLARRQNSASSFTGKDQETQLPQVHALNCLREIFTNSKFRIRTATWLIEALSLAASSLSSRTWAIRNCGLMLFRACANRMDSASEVSALGTNDTPSPNQSRIMLNIAFELLDPKEEIASGSSELVLAGLDLISRISIPENDRLQTRRKILAQLGRHVWIVREHASRVYAAQLPASETLEAATHLISSITLSDQNRSHGILLCARELLNRHVGYPLPFSDAETLELQEVLQCHTPSIMRCASPAVRCALLDILNDWPALQRAPRVTAHGTFSLDSPYSDPELPTVIRGELSDNHEIPFPSQLRGSLALGACLAILAGDPQATYTLLQVCKEVAANDLDAAAVLLQAVLEHGSRNRFTLQLLAEFYMAVIHNNYAEDITAIAMTGLSACLEQCLENSDLGAPMLRLECLFDDIVELPHNRGRDLFTATLRVLGSMLAYSSSMMHSVWDHRSSVQLKYWVAMLNGAAKDGTDALTRLNAARALHCFRHCLLQECDRIGVQKKIHLYSLLYDFLNDDDEEIRALAASTTSYILSAAAGGVNLQLSSLASCHQLSAFMAKSFSSKDEFHLLALSRIMLPTAIVFDELTSFAAIVSHHSVRVQLNFARQESHDLFEEERQNLYLDDVSEIETWHLALGKVAPSWIDDDVRELVEEWALNGVRELAIALPGLSHGPFGTLSKIKMLTLFLRVIQTTDLCLEWFFSSDFGFGPPQDSVHLIEMEQLLSVARECPIHPRAQKLLEQSVGRGRLGCHQMRLMAET